MYTVLCTLWSVERLPAIEQGNFRELSGQNVDAGVYILAPPCYVPAMAKAKVLQTRGEAKQNEILNLAFNIFYREGFHATGVDSILEGTGISKRSLYKFFGSKEALIKATIEHFQTLALRQVSDFINKKPTKNPYDKPLRIFDWVAEGVDNGDLKGCYAMNAKSEYANRDENIESACDAYTDALERLMEATIKEAGYVDAKKLAAQVMLLYRGTVYTTQSRRNSESAHAAKAAAKLVLNQARLRS